MRLEAIEFVPVTSELTSALPKSTCSKGENSCWSSSSTSYYFHLASPRTTEMPEEVPRPPPSPRRRIRMEMKKMRKKEQKEQASRGKEHESELQLQLQGESGSRKRRRRRRRRRRSSSISITSSRSKSSRHSCSFHHKVPLVSSSTCSSSLVQELGREEDCSDEADIEDEEMKKHGEKKVAHFAMSTSASAAASAPYFASLDCGSFLFSLMISLNLWIRDCSAKGTGVIGAAAGGSDSGVCSECGGNYTTEEMQMAISLCSLILLCFFGILCCQCYNRFYYEFVERHEHYHETKGMPPPPYIRNSLFKNQL